MSRTAKWVIVIIGVAVIVYLGTSKMNFAGVDNKANSVANKYATEVGAGERPPLINTDKGDLLLFMFGIGGAVAGFWIGYNWRDLFGKQDLKTERADSVADECE